MIVEIWKWEKRLIRRVDDLMKNVCYIDARLTFLIRELLNKIASFFINRMNAKMETIKQTKICPIVSRNDLVVE